MLLRYCVRIHSVLCEEGGRLHPPSVADEVIRVSKVCSIVRAWYGIFNDDLFVYCSLMLIDGSYTAVARFVLTIT